MTCHEAAVPFAAIPVRPWACDATHGLTVDCHDYEEFRSLPRAVSFGGRVYVRTGWNSDLGTAYYRDDVPFGLSVRVDKRLNQG